MQGSKKSRVTSISRRMLHAVPLPTRPALLAPRAPVLAMTSSPPKPIAAGALAFYFSFFFLSDVPPGPNVLNTPPDEFLSTVVDLSLNFFFVLPLTSSDAPVNDPIYESIFNTAIAFSLLFVGFAADGRKEATDDSLLSNKFFPYLAAMPFATNLAYLAYLAQREPLDAPPKKLNWLEQLGESPLLPASLVGMLALSLYWAVFARPEFGPPEDRLTLLSSLLSKERLAYALLGDCAFFALFQGWLLEDDLDRREEVGEEERARLLGVGRFVPYVGLAWYLWKRPPLRS